MICVKLLFCLLLMHGNQKYCMRGPDLYYLVLRESAMKSKMVADGEHCTAHQVRFSCNYLVIL